MFLIHIHGMYHFLPKRVAFRNDYCLSCNLPRRSVLIRTFDMWHVFWVPVLPLGFWRRWICTSCNRQPHVNRKTRRSFKWAGFVVLLFLSAAFWVAPVAPDFVAGAWAFRIGAAVGALLVLVHLLRTPKDPSVKERLASIGPTTDTICPFCGTQLLVLASACTCPSCGVVRA